MILDDQLTALYTKQLQFTDQLCATHNPIEVAAVMMVQALSLYRSVMSETDYNSIVETIAHNRDSVFKFEKAGLQ